MSEQKPIDHIAWVAQVATDLSQHLPPSARTAFIADAQARVDALKSLAQEQAVKVPRE